MKEGISLTAQAGNILERLVGHGSGLLGEVMVGREMTFICEVREGKIETLRQSVEHWACLRVIREQRLGYAYTTDLSERSILETVQQARENVDHTVPDPGWGLPDAFSQYPKGEYADPGYRSTSTAEKIQRALSIEREALAVTAKVQRLESAAYEDFYGTRAIVNSRGCQAEDQGTYFMARAGAIAEDGSEQQMGYDHQVSRFYEDMDLSAVARSASNRAAGMLGAVTLSTAEMPVVFAADVMGQILHAFSPVLSGQQVQKGKSPLAGRLGTRIAAMGITIEDDGVLARGLGSSRVDAEGVPSQRKILVENGVLHGFLHNMYSAKREGGRSTGNAVKLSFKGLPDVGITNLFIRPGLERPDDIHRRVGRALRVEEAMGLHTVDAISGDFSLAVNGHLLENGELTRAVRGITIAGNLLDLLQSVEAVGSDLIFKGSTGAPTILIRKMMVAGT